jgi:ribonuclease HI
MSAVKRVSQKAWTDLIKQSHLSSGLHQATAFCQPIEINLILTASAPGPNCEGLAFHCADGVPQPLRELYTMWRDVGLIEQLPTSGTLYYLAKQGVLLLNRCWLAKPTAEARAECLKVTQNLIYKIAELKPVVVIDQVGDLHGPNILPFCAESFAQVNRILHQYGFKKINFDPRSEIEREFNLCDRSAVVFTDGSCYPNKKTPDALGGYAVKFALGAIADTVLYGNIQNRPVYATNQRAEGQAIYETLKYMQLRNDELDRLIICTDSQFWISMFTAFMPKWSAEKFASMQNPDMTVPIYALYKQLIREGKRIEFRHIPAHDSARWSREPANSYKRFCYIHNDFVDHHATYARVHCKPGDNLVEINGELIDL